MFCSLWLRVAAAERALSSTTSALSCALFAPSALVSVWFGVGRESGRVSFAYSILFQSILFFSSLSSFSLARTLYARQRYTCEPNANATTSANYRPHGLSLFASEERKCAQVTAKSDASAASGERLAASASDAFKSSQPLQLRGAAPKPRNKPERSQWPPLTSAYLSSERRIEWALILCRRKRLGATRRERAKRKRKRKRDSRAH